ncbi:ATP-binding cassette domain-containing protein [Colwellia sp. 1_MG-2023]|jgi:cationic peptide transport system ATP-binding protein|uniref:peptide ABC transporter ATP-binding protein n=1 Tax=unclassified Colwellia TaxID=196834 RepID=UPI001C081392|nr:MULTISPECIES: ATP-binding cassette domain-containing protein [unclassified Colwellia]MBU2924581.1 ATP-binding cassette domain-containing protein [Colwellia sp. C2M11]MDO6489020.1 ATP-binding cassette domain-containing protein [Colwellia sp. 6_MG-2023]MDO6653944.1 ATP-binding cassette domain-containing protein [Colwellia sp. 3_MG-2023]MDO6666803.1 ATP-binding cassette domain-containing protein [Colwellia sp. 2_MG-2023]MDO6691212.1 ATP-binding cassette domain-containing protein [Colwellia sp.
MTELLKVEELSKSYQQKGFWFKKKVTIALEPISFSIEAHKTLAIIGDTGSGKSTLAKLLVGAEPASSGHIYLNGKKLHDSSYKERCQHIRMIFQDSGTTLNPSLTILQLLDEPLKLNTTFNEKKRQELIRVTLQQVGLLGDHMNFYPHMFSGGQKQRISLARAIILQPQVIILDEALAALDPSLRSQMINLLLDLQQQMGLAYILISHNLGIIRHFSDEVLVLSHGKVVESGKTMEVMNKPQHKVTQRLLMNQNFQLRSRTVK